MKTQKLLRYFGLATAILLTSLATSSKAVVIMNFANQIDTVIQFNGAANSFEFTTSAATGYQWSITSETGGSSAVGLMGSFLSGPFYYGSITTSGAIQSATVTGPLADFVINDGTGNLTAKVNWIDITTGFQSAGVLNGLLNVNLTGVNYTGSNPDLLYLKDNAPGTLDLTFQFSPGKNLSDLSSGTGPYTTSYSGTLSVVAIPDSFRTGLALLGGVICLSFIQHRQLRKGS